MQDELDKELLSRFREQHRTLAEDPFRSTLLRVIVKRQSRRLFVRKLISVLGFACCALLSPFLIKGSILLSGGLNAIMSATEAFLSTPPGSQLAALSALLVLFFNRRYILRFI